MAKKSPGESPRAPRRRTGASQGNGDGDGARSALRTAAPTEEDIARRAYEIYRERGGQDGYDMDDWLRAEQELRSARGR